MMGFFGDIIGKVSKIGNTIVGGVGNVVGGMTGARPAPQGQPAQDSALAQKPQEQPAQDFTLDKNTKYWLLGGVGLVLLLVLR